MMQLSYEPTTLSIKDACGRQISLLNDQPSQPPLPQQKQKQSTATTSTNGGRRRYHCTERGCNKSFTTR